MTNSVNRFKGLAVAVLGLLVALLLLAACLALYGLVVAVIVLVVWFVISLLTGLPSPLEATAVVSPL